MFRSLLNDKDSPLIHMNLVKHGPGNSLFSKCFRYCWLIVRRFDVLNTFLIYYHALAICYVKSNTIFSKQSNSLIFNIIYFFRMGNIVRRFEQDRILSPLRTDQQYKYYFWVTTLYLSNCSMFSQRKTAWKQVIIC